MGPLTTKPTPSQYAQLLLDFDLLQRWETESVSLLRSRSDGREYLLREFTFNDKREFEVQAELLQRRKAQLEVCPHLLHLHRILTLSQDQLCSTYFKLHALFQWESHSLDDEANQRNLQKRSFQERELWSIAAGCILALSHLQKQGIAHRTLTSRAVLFSEAGSLRLYDPIATAAPPNFDLLLTKRTTPHVYIAPEQCEQLQEECAYNTNHFKGDVWTLGMILLEAALSHSQDECYRDEYSRIHWETLNFNLNRFAQAYSPELTALLQLMLTREEALRPDWVDLAQRIASENSNQQSARSSHASKYSHSQQQRIYQQVSYSEPPRNPPFATAYKAPPLASPLNLPLKASSATGIAPSSIDGRRPLRSLFPVPSYLTISKPDENLIYLPEQYSEASESGNREDSYFNSAGRAEVGSPGELRNRQASSELRNRQASSKALSPLLPTHQLEVVVEKYRQGSEYRGQKWRGMRHGRGVFLYLDGGKYEGEWNFNKMEGKGCLYYQSGKLAYEGQWLEDQFSGKGTLYNQSPEPLSPPYPSHDLDQVQDFWVKYEGEFKADLKCGHGLLFLSNGQSFEGQFLDDFAEGAGVFRRKDGSEVGGIWRNNRLIR